MQPRIYLEPFCYQCGVKSPLASSKQNRVNMRLSANISESVDAFFTAQFGKTLFVLDNDDGGDTEAREVRVMRIRPRAMDVWLGCHDNRISESNDAGEAAHKRP